MLEIQYGVIWRHKCKEMQKFVNVAKVSWIKKKLLHPLEEYRFLLKFYPPAALTDHSSYGEVSTAVEIQNCI